MKKESDSPFLAYICYERMATSTSPKTPCATCGKIAGLFTCRGCQKDFCKRHVAEHQQELSKQFDELIFEHDQFRESLMKQTQESRHDALMKQIDEWEQESINKIRHTANEIRKELQTRIGQHTSKLTEDLTEMAQDLRKAREEDDFHEKDLKQWMDKLNNLKRNLTQPPNIDIRKENNNTILFIPKIVLSIFSNEIFGQSIGDIRIEDNGQLIVKGQSNGLATARGSGEYSSGEHRFRLRIEVNNSDKWLFIGIISKSVCIQAKSYDSKSSYGWAGDDQVYINGVQMLGFNGYKPDIEKSDIVEFLVDCDQRSIRLTNERTHSIHTLAVDTEKSPFPWQLNFNLYYLNDCVRIL